MNTLKRIAQAILVFFVLAVNIEAQENKDLNFLKSVYLSAGYEFSSLNNSDEYSKLVDNGGIMVSAKYDFRPQIQFDLRYVYHNNISYNYLSQMSNFAFGYSTHELFDGIKSHDFSIKVNYFLSKKREENPVYLTAGINAAVQSVRLYELYDEAVFDSTRVLRHVSTFENIDSHTRFLVGPEAGAGFFLAFGKINFLSEFTFSARFSPFRDKAYRELSFNIVNGLVYKF